MFYSSSARLSHGADASFISAPIPTLNSAPVNALLVAGPAFASHAPYPASQARHPARYIEPDENEPPPPPPVQLRVPVASVSFLQDSFMAVTDLDTPPGKPHWAGLDEPARRALRAAQNDLATAHWRARMMYNALRALYAHACVQRRDRAGEELALLHWAHTCQRRALRAWVGATVASEQKRANSRQIEHIMTMWQSVLRSRKASSQAYHCQVIQHRALSGWAGLVSARRLRGDTIARHRARLVTTNVFAQWRDLYESRCEAAATTASTALVAKVTHRALVEWHADAAATAAARARAHARAQAMLATSVLIQWVRARQQKRRRQAAQQATLAATVQAWHRVADLRVRLRLQKAEHQRCAEVARGVVGGWRIIVQSRKQRASTVAKIVTAQRCTQLLLAWQQASQARGQASVQAAEQVLNKLVVQRAFAAWQEVAQSTHTACEALRRQQEHDLCQRALLSMQVAHLVRESVLQKQVETAKTQLDQRTVSRVLLSWSQLCSEVSQKAAQVAVSSQNRSLATILTRWRACSQHRRILRSSFTMWHDLTLLKHNADDTKRLYHRQLVSWALESARQVLRTHTATAEATNKHERDAKHRIINQWLAVTQARVDQLVSSTTTSLQHNSLSRLLREWNAATKQTQTSAVDVYLHRRRLVLHNTVNSMLTVRLDRLSTRATAATAAAATVSLTSVVTTWRALLAHHAAVDAANSQRWALRCWHGLSVQVGAALEGAAEATAAARRGALVRTLKTWQAATVHVQSVHYEAENKVRSHHAQVQLVAALQSWRAATQHVQQKVLAATAATAASTTQRSFLAWRKVAEQAADQRHNLALVSTVLPAKTALSSWQLALATRRAEAQNELSKVQLRRCLRAWSGLVQHQHYLANGVTTLHNHNTTNQTFLAWQQLHAHVQAQFALADHHHCRHLLARALTSLQPPDRCTAASALAGQVRAQRTQRLVLAWLTAARNAKNKMVAAEKLADATTRSRTQSVLRVWLQAAQASHNSLTTATTASNTSLLHSYLAEWQNQLAIRRSARQVALLYQHRVLVQLVSTWRRRARRAQRDRQRFEVADNFRRSYLLYRALSGWHVNAAAQAGQRRANYGSLETAQTRSGLRAVLRGWKGATTASREWREDAQQKLQEHQRRSVLTKVLSEVHSRVQARQAVQTMKRRRQITAVLRVWRRETRQNQRGAQAARLLLERKVLQAWIGATPSVQMAPIVNRIRLRTPLFTPVIAQEKTPITMKTPQSLPSTSLRTAKVPTSHLRYSYAPLLKSPEVTALVPPDLQ